MAQMLSETILAQYRQYKAGRSDRRPVRSNTASQLAYPCPAGARYMVLKRQRWEAAEMPSPELQMIYDEGRLQEAAVLRDLAEAGLTVIEQQTAVEWRQYNITGHLDAKLLWNGTAVPIEIKSLSPYSWQAHQSVADMLDSKYPWMRGYPGQLLIYLMLTNAEVGMLITKNKANGQIRCIDLNLYEHLAYAESLVRLAEEVNQHIAADTVPPAVEYQDWVCGRCSMFNVCTPPMASTPPDVIEDSELLEALDERASLEAARKRYETLDKTLKERFKGNGGVRLCGEWVIETKLSTRKKMEYVPTGETIDVPLVSFKRYAHSDSGGE